MRILVLFEFHLFFFKLKLSLSLNYFSNQYFSILVFINIRFIQDWFFHKLNVKFKIPSKQNNFVWSKRNWSNETNSSCKRTKTSNFDKFIELCTSKKYYWGLQILFVTQENKLMKFYSTTCQQECLIYCAVVLQQFIKCLPLGVSK